MTALKRKDFSGVVNKEKDKGKDETTTEDDGNRKGAYSPVLYGWAILTVNLGKTKAENRKRLRKRTIQRLVRMLGTFINLVAEDASRVSHSLSFLCPDIASRN